MDGNTGGDGVVVLGPEVVGAGVAAAFGTAGAPPDGAVGAAASLEEGGVVAGSERDTGAAVGVRDGAA